MTAQPLLGQPQKPQPWETPAYVLIVAITGPLIARAGEPLGRTVARRVTARRERSEQSIRGANAPRASAQNGAVAEAP